MVNECTTDPQGRTSLQQMLLIRRGNCDPVPVMAVGPSMPAPDPTGLCLELGGSRLGAWFIRMGVFQNMAVLPDGSGVVFDVTKEFSELPAATPEPPEEGIFFVKANGTGLRRLGPASRIYTIFGGVRWGVSPNGRTIVFVDLGPATAGYEAPQVFLLDSRSGRRRQLTHQPRVANLEFDDPGISVPSFLNRRTIGFYSGSTSDDSWRAFQVGIHGGRETEVPPITVAPGAQLVSQFGVTGAHPHTVLVLFPDRPAVNRPDDPDAFAREIFLIDGKSIVQLTAFNRSDTFTGGAQGVSPMVRGQVLIAASANPFGENPGEICQLFTISTRGDHLRQLTHLPWDGRRTEQGCVFNAPGCGIFELSPAVDQVTGTVLFESSCDPVGANPFGDQLFAMRPDATGLRQLTSARGMTTDPDGTLHVEVAGPFAYSQRGGD